MHPFFKTMNWTSLEKREVEPPFKPKVVRPTGSLTYWCAFFKPIGRGGGGSLEAGSIKVLEDCIYFLYRLTLLIFLLQELSNEEWGVRVIPFLTVP